MKKSLPSKRPLSISKAVSKASSPVVTPVTLAEQVWVEGRRQWTKEWRRGTHAMAPVPTEGYESFLFEMSEEQREEYWKGLLSHIPQISPIQLLKDDPVLIAALDRKLGIAKGEQARRLKNITPTKIAPPRSGNEPLRGKTNQDETTRSDEQPKRSEPFYDGEI